MNLSEIRDLIPQGHKRFWSKVAVKGADDCWEWQSSRFDNGYGKYWMNGKIVKAHRFAFFLFNDLRFVRNVLHKCDNPCCVNPLHLFEGSLSDNTQDMIAKGRNRVFVGSQNGNSKLSEVEVAEIRRWIEIGMTDREISQHFDLKVQHVNKIRHRRIR